MNVFSFYSIPNYRLISSFTLSTGSYIFIETSSPRNSGDKAKLELSVPVSGSSCLVFFYHMYGSSMGSLNVFDGNKKVFNESGNKGDNWHKAEVTISSNKVSKTIDYL